MALEAVGTAPQIEDYKPLTEHEEQTPVTFFGGPAVLYLYSPNATILVSRAQLNDTPALKKLVTDQPASEEEHGAAAAAEDEEVAISNVGVWVSSRNVTLFGAEEGVAISYPSIALHAMGTHESRCLPDGAAPVVFLQINVHDPETTNSDDEMHTLDLTIHATEIAAGPSSSSSTSTTIAEGDGADTTISAPTAVKALFEALSACADLHPDPNEDEDTREDGDVEPGAGGWITAENMHEFVDEDGNFVPPNASASSSTSLGPGAGTVRTRDEEENGVNGDATDDAKWQRTD